MSVNIAFALFWIGAIVFQLAHLGYILIYGREFSFVKDGVIIRRKRSWFALAEPEEERDRDPNIKKLVKEDVVPAVKDGKITFKEQQ